MNKVYKTIIILLVLIFATTITRTILQHFTNKKVEERLNLNYQYSIVGKSTWYKKGETRSGEKFTGELLSCASVYFPRYALLLVRNTANNRKVLVWNNDVHEATEIVCDLSGEAFGKVAEHKIGKILVEITYLGILEKPNKEIFGNKESFLNIISETINNITIKTNRK